MGPVHSSSMTWVCIPGNERACGLEDCIRSLHTLYIHLKYPLTLLLPYVVMATAVMETVTVAVFVIVHNVT